MLAVVAAVSADDLFQVVVHVVPGVRGTFVVEGQESPPRPSHGPGPGARVWCESRGWGWERRRMG